jgi:hypothetical protein
LFFPATSNPRDGFAADVLDDARAPLARVLSANEKLQAMFIATGATSSASHHLAASP